MSQRQEDLSEVARREAPVPSGTELRQLVGELKGRQDYGTARQILARARAATPGDVWITQQLALCTYKDEELAPWSSLEDALRLLETIGLRDTSAAEPETLALGGAVYKRMWERGGQLDHLYEALLFYRAAWEKDPAADLGYGGVNAAYILDQLASRARAAARRSGASAQEASVLEAEARKLREAIRGQLEEEAGRRPAVAAEYWYAVTVAEVLFGLGEYERAGEWLGKAAAAGASEWQTQTTFRQLASLARLRGATLPNADPQDRERACQALGKLVGGAARIAVECPAGKVGLALSGGGFRASLFHLGVLARLAEMDVLRSVEALSTVSGGSIVGAHYYLEVQRLLERKPDGEITREDYVEVVHTVLRQFLDGVQRNVRMRVMASVAHNLKMLFPLGYSRTHRLGELYESELYARVEDGRGDDSPRTLPQLLVQPAPGEGGKAAGFRPKTDNWRRRAKVPVLLLNTTSLNSGHNWHFTASWMGEPPGLTGEAVDKNARYRRLYYRQAPTRDLRNFRLGHAVAASSCVPGLFEPLAISGLYPESVVQLVDGGVHDNQGVAGLLDEGCNLILCSDASGQMGDLAQPKDGLLSVLTRSGSIQGDRVRETEYQDLEGRLAGGSLQGLFFIHLKKDVEVHPLDWVGCQDPRPGATEPAPVTPYGVAPDLQSLLAGVRTDLDSFTEVEAYALMASGYLMTEQQFRAILDEERRSQALPVWGQFQVDAPRGEWPFRDLVPLLAIPEDAKDPRRERLAEQLRVARKRGFKIWHLNPLLRAVARAAGLAVAVLLLVVIWVAWGEEVRLSVRSVILTLLALGLGALVPLWKVFDPEKAKRSLLMKLGFATAGYVVAKLHLWFFDRWFLAHGTLERLLGQGSGGSAPQPSREDKRHRP